MKNVRMDEGGRMEKKTWIMNERKERSKERGKEEKYGTMDGWMDGQ